MLPAPAVAPIAASAEAIKGNPETTKPSELLGSDGVRGAYDTLCNDPDGSRTTSGNLGENELESILGSACGSILSHPYTIQLLSIWAKLDEPARHDLLAVARGWVKVAQ